MSNPVRAGDPKRGGAAWCEEHQRWECSKRAKSSPVCHGVAIAGLDRCRMHAGESGGLARAKGAALSAWRAMPGVQEVTPSEAVMQMLQVSWARFHLYASLLEQQVADAQGEAGTGLGDDPELGPGAGLIGHTRSGVKDIGIFATGEAARGLTLLEEKERDRCVRYAKTAHDMGIADREIRLAEAQGALLAGAITRILDALELSPSQRARVPEVVPGVLLEIAGEAGPRA